MFESIKAVSAQNIFKVQPVSMNDGSNGRNQTKSDVNIFAGINNSLNAPSIQGSATLGKSLDLLA